MFMKIKGLSVLVAVVLLVPVGVAADTPAQAANGADGAGEGNRKAKKMRKKKPEMICRRERVTGSHMRQRVCRTAEQEAARRENDQRALGGMLSMPSSTPG